ncbi:MAG: chromate transporter [Bacilli bacterium]|nr:chromate transporter [Bacilli bacterium]
MEKEKFSYLRLFLKFFKIGLFTFGGGYAMLPLIERDIIQSNWIEKEDVTDLVAISQSIPGAIAINMALLVGHRIGKKKGAIVATLGCIMPSFLVILIIAMALSNFQDYVIVQRAFTGILSCVVALILIAAFKFAKIAIMDIPTLLITIITIIVLVSSKLITINSTLSSLLPVLLIIAGGLVGLLFYYVYPKKVREVMKRGSKK